MNRVNAKAPKAKTIGVGQLLESEYCKCVSIQMKPVFVRASGLQCRTQSESCKAAFLMIHSWKEIQPD